MFTLKTAMRSTVDTLLNPSNLWSRSEVLVRPCPIPLEQGIYAWYFRSLPPGVPESLSPQFDGLHLLYIGVSPAHESSKNNLRKRIQAHFRGNASSSTLRLTLGCLLSNTIGLRLRPTGSTGRLTFADDETILSDWLEQNAFVTWVSSPRPWVIEKDVISNISPLLNLQHNKSSPFHSTLSAIRHQAQAAARAF